MAESKRITLVEKEDFTLDLEWGQVGENKFAILHLPRMKMNRSSYTEFLVYMPQLYEFISTFGYEAIHTAVDNNDTAIAKLLDRIGAELLGNDPETGLDVYEYKGEA